jgi:hypothetical protein
MELAMQILVLSHQVRERATQAPLNGESPCHGCGPNGRQPNGRRPKSQLLARESAR